MVPLRPIRPLELIAADIVGPLPVSTTGKKYILVIIDHFTKYVKLYSLQDITAKTSAKKIFNFMCNYGIPDSILTDQGKNFQSELMTELWELLDTNKLRTSPYHPETDGVTERFNRTLKQMLACYVNENQTDWDLYLDNLQYAYNSAIHSTTKFSPFELFFGRLPKLPIDLCHHGLPQFDTSYHTVGEDMPFELVKDEYAYRVRRHFEKIFKTVAENRDLRMDRAKLIHDRKVRGSNFKKDDLVLMYNHVIKPGTTKKLCNKWKGPYCVVDCLNGVNYKIKHLVKRGKPFIVHKNNLKRFYGSINFEKSVLQEELAQPNTGPTNLINEFVKSPLNITAGHGDLNTHPGYNQNVTQNDVTNAQTTQRDENETVPINLSDENSKLIVSLYKPNYYLQKMVGNLDSGKSPRPIRHRRRPDFYQAAKFPSLNNVGKLGDVKNSSISVTQFTGIEDKNDEDFLLRAPLDYVFEYQVEAKGSAKLNNGNEVSPFRKGKGKDKENKNFIADSHGDLSVSKPEQVAVPVVTEDKVKEAHQVGSNNNLNLNNKNKIGKVNSVLSPKIVTYGPGTSNQQSKCFKSPIKTRPKRQRKKPDFFGF